METTRSMLEKAPKSYWISWDTLQAGADLSGSIVGSGSTWIVRYWAIRIAEDHLALISYRLIGSANWSLKCKFIFINQRRFLKKILISLQQLNLKTLTFSRKTRYQASCISVWDSQIMFGNYEIIGNLKLSIDLISLRRESSNFNIFIQYWNLISRFWRINGSLPLTRSNEIYFLHPLILFNQTVSISLATRAR